MKNAFVHLFIEQVKSNPYQTALIQDKRTLSYQALDNISNQFANYLLRHGLQTEDFVIIFMDRSIAMLIAILGVLKAGGAYVPIDPQHPVTHIKHILTDTSAKLLITSKTTKIKIIPFTGEIITLGHNLSWLSTQHNRLPAIQTDMNNLAYIIYTSGSTGKPKGVMIERKSLADKLIALRSIYQLNINDTCLLYRSFAFDGSIEEYLLPLISGSRCVIMPTIQTIPLMTQLIRQIKKHAVSIVNIMPSLLPYFIEKLDEKKIQPYLTSLKKIVVGGEIFHANLSKQLLSKLDVSIYNMYGPTENTIDSTFFHLSRLNIQNITTQTVPIGKPFPMTTAYVLDEKLNRISNAQQSGELYLGGTGLARGYLNQPNLTREKFIANPFGKGRLYRTGDLVKQLPCGNLEFIGRADNQVKIRGFRVELEGIQAAILKHKNITATHTQVRVNQNAEHILVAYVVPKNYEQYNPTVLRKHLLQQLPYYSVPHHIIPLHELPITPQGKVNSKKLAQIPIEKKAKPTIAHALDPAEKSLMAIWEKAFQTKISNPTLSFFELGGQSLIASTIIHAIEKTFRRVIDIQDIYQHDTVSKLAKFVEKSDKIANIERYQLKSSRQKIFPLSYAQNLIWIHQYLNLDHPLYNEPLTIHMPTNDIDVLLLEKSLNYFIKRHDILRSRLCFTKKIPKQLIHKHTYVSLPFTDLSAYSERHKLKVKNKILNRMVTTRFDFENESMIRCHLIKYAMNDFKLHLVAHHLISDGISMYQILMRELEYIYRALLARKKPNVIKLEYQYRDFCTLQSRHLSLNQDKQYWSKKLNGFTLPLLPTRKLNDQSNNPVGTLNCFVFPKEALFNIKQFAKAHKATLFSTLYGVFMTLLYQYTHQTDLTIGTVVSNRPHTGFDHVFGNFLNTLLLRTTIKPNDTFKNNLRYFQQEIATAHKHGKLPFQEVLKLIHYQSSLHQLPFNIAFIFETEAYQSQLNWQVDQTQFHSKQVKFDLLFELDARQEALIGRVEYKTQLFSSRFISQLIEQFCYLMHQLVENPELPIRAFPAFPNEMQSKLLHASIGAKKKFNAMPLHRLIEQQAALQSNKIALQYKNKAITYKQLNEQSNQLAHYLIKKGIQVENRVVILMERSESMVVAFLGVLKAGGAYVPIDPQNPRERIQFMINDTNARLIITETHLKHKFGLSNHPCIHMDNPSVFSNEPIDNPRININVNHLAYIIYTSGSTGKPKGVMIEHQGVYNTVLVTKDIVKLNNRDKCLAITSLQFDVSVCDYFLTFACGGTVVIADNQTILNVKSLIQLIQRERISFLQATPGMLQVLLSCHVVFKHQIKILSAGEALPNDIAKKLRRIGKIFNFYGPTEASIYATSTHINKERCQSVTIGQPIDNTSAYVLNNKLQLLPYMVVGELYLGGRGLARGYLNQPNLTQERFISNPLGKGRLYRTGDLVRRLPCGNLEFIARTDNQVKIRGFRVELAEIEQVIASVESIKQVIVILNKTDISHQSLIAYLVPKQRKHTVDVVLVKKRLAESLPPYMWPNEFHLIDQIPLTTAKKVDRAALQSIALKNKTDISHPKKRVRLFGRENELARIWQSLLKNNRLIISKDSNFFELGGNSLLAIEMLFILEKKYQVKLPICHLYQNPTIGQINQMIIDKME